MLEFLLFARSQELAFSASKPLLKPARFAVESIAVSWISSEIEVEPGCPDLAELDSKIGGEVELLGSNRLELLAQLGLPAPDAGINRDDQKSRRGYCRRETSHADLERRRPPGGLLQTSGGIGCSTHVPRH